jgi:Protein of unknown function (DUF2634).
MIPETIVTVTLSEETIDTKTYYINFDKNRLQGEIEGLESVKQSIICMLSTERYAYIIHTWQYGATIEKYIGKNYDYIVADIDREITETLMTDNRILKVSNFKFKQEDEKLIITLNVDTIYGNLKESVVI